MERGDEESEELREEEWEDEEWEYFAEDEEEGLEEGYAALRVDEWEDEWGVDGGEDVDHEGVGDEGLGVATQFGGYDGCGGGCGAYHADHGALRECGGYGSEDEVGGGASDELEEEEVDVPSADAELARVDTAEGEEELHEDEARGEDAVECPHVGVQWSEEVEAMEGDVEERAEEHCEGESPVADEVYDFRHWE